MDWEEIKKNIFSEISNDAWFRLEHVIASCGVSDVISFTFGNMPDYYIVLAERSEVGVYRYRGSSGFVRDFALPVASARTLHWVDGDGLLVIGGRDTVVVYRAVTVGQFVQESAE